MAEETPTDLTADEEDEPVEEEEEERVTELEESVISDSSNTDMPDPKFYYLYNTPQAIAERENFDAYMEEYRRTKGFDMVTRYNRGGITPLPLDFEDDPHGLIRACRTGVEDAIDFKNKQINQLLYFGFFWFCRDVNFVNAENMKLKLLEILKCNYGFHYIFYATCEVVDENTGHKFTYQAKVRHSRLDDMTKIHRFKFKLESDA